ncbi:CrcB protein [Alkalimonas amylolytica]|uniref:Fluoride-specific ion channel FluC n=1 Tax=Alkalimonas amylolytica TaxID=152573 RepID=A0A1H3X7H2_ALKAM|nr:CrcB protein [Alkalimonas amylolytica]
MIYLLVGLGSGLGASLRLLLSVFLHQPDALWPWATLLVNLLGSALIGFYATMVGTNGRWQASEPLKQFVLAGFCGGFTTFSVFSLEGLQLLLAGHGHLAVLYVLISLLAWLLAVWFGSRLAQPNQFS